MPRAKVPARERMERAMTISEKVAYLKGLADGLDLDQETSKEGKLIAKIIDVLEDVGFAVEDLSDVETVIFDEEDEDENGCCGSCSALDDDDFFQIACPSCGADIVIDESVLDIGEVTCPNCGDKFSLDLTDEPVDEDEPEA